MQHLRIVALVSWRLSAAQDANPLGAVIKLLDDLKTKVSQQATDEDEAYRKYADWCGHMTKEKQFSLETKARQKEYLEATMEEFAATIETSSAKIDELAAQIAESDAELKSATSVRETEAKDFVAGEKELLDVIDALSRAVSVLERKGAATLAQLPNDVVSNVLRSLSVVVDAASLATDDKQRLAAFLQSDDSDELSSAPAAAVYEFKSGGIIEVLEDLKEKAQSQLADLRKAETQSRHNYELVAQSLRDQTKADTKDLDTTKSRKAAAEEGKATAEGDLAATISDWQATKADLDAITAGCMQVAVDHEVSVKSRNDELKVIAEAKKVLQESTGGAVDTTYSLLQTSVRNRAQQAKSSLTSRLKELARHHHSAALAQLASRIEAILRSGASSSDAFAKVKDLIKNLIAKLQKEAGEEATEKAFCDSELKTAEAKKGELQADVEKLTTKIDQDVAESNKRKEEVKELQTELANTLVEQAELDQIRKTEHETFVKTKAALEDGLVGVRRALVVLRDYYAAAKEDQVALLERSDISSFMQQPPEPEKHTSASGAGTGIIGILEVVESDFAQTLAKEQTQEDDAQEAYEKTTQENKLESASKTKDVEYKTQEYTRLDKNIVELSSDRDNSNTELAAVLEYYSKLQQRCIAKPEAYEQRKQRREAEIIGLKEALAALNSDLAELLQTPQSNSRRMRWPKRQLVLDAAK